MQQFLNLYLHPESFCDLIAPIVYLKHRQKIEIRRNLSAVNVHQGIDMIQECFILGHLILSKSVSSLTDGSFLSSEMEAFLSA